MQRSQGNTNPPLISCINPVKDRWRVRWDVTVSDGEAEWMEQDFDHRPSSDEVRELIVTYINEQTHRNIVEGFTYDGDPVYLSLENQQNIMTMLTIAKFSLGTIFPLTIKLGTDAEPIYKEFKTIISYSAFCFAMAEHIKHCLEEGYRRKRGIDLNSYQL